MYFNTEEGEVDLDHFLEFKGWFNTLSYVLATLPQLSYRQTAKWPKIAQMLSHLNLVASPLGTIELGPILCHDSSTDC